MSDFTWTETPNDPNTPLAMGPFTTLHFTASTAIDYIAIDVGTGVEECAFRDGAFRGLYAGASTIDNTLKVVSLYRSGGWPAPPKVFPKIAASGGTGVEVVSIINLSTGPNYDKVTTPTIDSVSVVVFRVVSGSAFNGLAAPADTSKPHYIRIINDSGFAVNIAHEDTNNASASSRFYNVIGHSDITWQTGETRSAVWMPASMSLTGTARWFIFTA